MDPPASEMGIDLETQSKPKTLTDKELPADWPQIANPKEERAGYQALYGPNEDRSQPPSQHSHTERLSYGLTQGAKELRFFAVDHKPQPENVNYNQYQIIEASFNSSPPQLVLFEGDFDVNYPLTRELALQHGEQAWMSYLVQQHNQNLKEGEKPIVIESGDLRVNRQPNEIRDPEIIKDTAKKFATYDRIDMVFGSGHAIREKQAWEQFFDAPAQPILEVK